MEITKQAEEMAAQNDLLTEINQAYINIVGEDCAEAEDAEEAYQGEYQDDEAFARETADQLGLLNDQDIQWPYSCIDWERAARDLMFDYSEDNGHYFRNL